MGRESEGEASAAPERAGRHKVHPSRADMMRTLEASGAVPASNPHSLNRASAVRMLWAATAQARDARLTVADTAGRWCEATPTRRSGAASVSYGTDLGHSRRGIALKKKFKARVGRFFANRQVDQPLRAIKPQEMRAKKRVLLGDC